MKVIALILTCLIVLAVSVLLAFGQPLPPLPPAPTNSVRRATVPRPVLPALTNLVLSWLPYTNSRIEIFGTTNLASTNWVMITNVPLWATNVSVPMTKPQQFFKIRAVFDGVLTNY